MIKGLKGKHTYPSCVEQVIVQEFLISVSHWP